MENAVKSITTEIRNEVITKLQKRFPHIQFIAFWDNFVKMHVIGVDNVKFNNSHEFDKALLEIGEAYEPDYDIFDICYAYEDFDENGLIQKPNVPVYRVQASNPSTANPLHQT